MMVLYLGGTHDRIKYQKSFRSKFTPRLLTMAKHAIHAFTLSSQATTI
jgi:hypothetical protein